MKQADTARAVYHRDIEPTLEARQKFVRDHLRAYLEEYAQAPTGLELLAFAQRRCPTQRLDVNTIRPRLTELHDRGLVRMGEKRRCRESGKRVFTWELAEPAKPSAQEPTEQFFQF